MKDDAENQLVTVTLTRREWLAVRAALGEHRADISRLPIMSRQTKRAWLGEAADLVRKFDRLFPMEAR